MLIVWKQYISSRKNLYETIITLLSLVIILIVLPDFLERIEQREGVVFNDPLLKLFDPVDLTWLTFLVIYGGLLAAIFHLADKPEFLLTAFRAYVLLALFRMIGMFLLPLNPPENIILLDDPVVQFFGSGDVLTKDLFFSGHTSTMFLFFLSVKSNKMRYLFLAATILIGIFVLLQHVHYSIDVFAAPFFGFTSYKISVYVKMKYF